MAAAATAGKVKSNDDAEPAGSEKGEIKRLLRLSQGGDPIFMALALDANGKAIIRVDRRRQPRALEKELKEADPDSRNHRFGTMSADPAKPKTVQFKVNKAASGLARKLVVALKGTGYNKVEISSDDGGPPEIHTEPDADDVPDGKTPGQPAKPVANAPVGASAGTQAGAAAGAPPAAKPAIDTGKLVAELTPLVRRVLEIAKTNPAQKAPLQKLATAAQTSLRSAMLSLKPDELKHAQSDIEALHDAVEKAEREPPPANDPMGFDPNIIGSMLAAMARKAAPAMKANPEHAKPFKTHLVAAHAALKAGDFGKAQENADLAEQLFGMMGGKQAPDGASGLAAAHAAANGASGLAAAAAKPPHTDLFNKAAQEWEQVMSTVKSEAEMVIARVTKAFAEHGHRNHIVTEFQKGVSAAVALGGPSVSLEKHLFLMAKSHADDLVKHVKTARAIVKQHIDHITANPLLAELEHNPLVSVKLQQHLVAGLKSVTQLLSRF